MEKPTLLAVLVTFLSSFCLAGSSPSFSPANAGCFIRGEKGILFVRDAWSGKWSLPGGTSEPGESPSQTALREVFEETQWKVFPQNRLAALENGFQIFHCQVLAGISRSGLPVPSREGAREILEVNFFAPNTLPHSKWRFPSQKNLLIGLFDQAPLQTFSEIVEMGKPEPTPILKLQLRAIAEFQNSLQSVRASADAFFSFANRLAEEPMFIFTLLWIIVFLGQREGVRCFLTFSIAVLAHVILKDHFEILRPFHYEPSLQRSAATGFSFPSGHSTQAGVIFGSLYFYSRKNWRWLWPTLALAAGLARVYVGVHYPLDVIAGLSLGASLAAVSWIFRHFQYQLQIQIFVWTIFGALGIAYVKNPTSLAVLSSGLGLLAGWLLQKFFTFDHAIFWRSAEDHAKQSLMAYSKNNHPIAHSNSLAKLPGNFKFLPTPDLWVPQILLISFATCLFLGIKFGFNVFAPQELDFWTAFNWQSSRSFTLGLVVFLVSTIVETLKKNRAGD